MIPDKCKNCEQNITRNTLVLRAKPFIKPESIQRIREDIAAQIKRADGVIIVSSCFDVMFVPEGTEVRIEGTIKEKENPEWV